MEISKAKVTIAFISILLHLYLFITFPLTEILHPPVSDIWMKPPGSSTCIVVKAFPVAADKKTKDTDIKRNDRVEKYKTSPPLKPDFTEKRQHLMKQVVRHTEKRTIRHMFANEHKILLAQANPDSFSVSSRQMPAFARTRVVTKLAADSKSMPRPRMKKMADISPGNQSASELQRYTKIIKDKIANNIFYPPLARRKGIEGIVLIGFLITHNGLLRDIRLIEPSDYDILNRAAITTINNASPFLPFPESINKKELWLKLALSFKLNQ
jgi:protein TonB